MRTRNQMNDNRYPWVIATISLSAVVLLSVTYQFFSGVKDGHSCGANPNPRLVVESVCVTNIYRLVEKRTESTVITNIVPVAMPILLGW